MRNLLCVVAFLVGCGSRPGLRPDMPTSDGGPDPDCVNTIEEVPLEIRSHVCFDFPSCEQITLAGGPVYHHNPPSSGAHYWVWARWQIHSQTVPRGYWVHNLEHGGVVFLYRPDAPPSLVESLIRVFNAIPPDPGGGEVHPDSLPCDHGRVVLTPDPLLDTPWAVTVSGPEMGTQDNPIGNGYDIKGDCIRSEQALVDFAVQRRNRSVEGICDQGFYPP